MKKLNVIEIENRLLFTQAVFYFVKNIVVIIDWSCVYISFLLQ